MENLILFLNSFMSYLLVVFAIVAGAALAFFAGRVLKKIKTAKSVENE